MDPNFSLLYSLHYTPLEGTYDTKSKKYRLYIEIGSYIYLNLFDLFDERCMAKKIINFSDTGEKNDVLFTERIEQLSKTFPNVVFELILAYNTSFHKMYFLNGDTYMETANLPKFDINKLHSENTKNLENCEN